LWRSQHGDAAPVSAAPRAAGRLRTISACTSDRRRSSRLPRLPAQPPGGPGAWLASTGRPPAPGTPSGMGSSHTMTPLCGPLNVLPAEPVSTARGPRAEGPGMAPANQAQLVGRVERRSGRPHSSTTSRISRTGKGKSVIERPRVTRRGRYQRGEAPEGVEVDLELEWIEGNSTILSPRDASRAVDAVGRVAADRPGRRS